MDQLATLQDDALTVAAGDFVFRATVGDISGTWDSLSHFPDRRARAELADLATRLNTFQRFFLELVAAGGAIGPAELERFARRHVSLTRRMWALESRCMSWFVVGPARFPIAQNEKRLRASDRGYQTVREHTAAARKAVERAAFPHGPPGGPIRSNNPDAVDLIREEIARHLAQHAAMKAANAAIRATRDQEHGERVQAIVDATGWRPETAARALEPDCMKQIGFPSYSLARKLAEVKRLEGRLAELERNAARGHVETRHNTTEGDVVVIQNPQAARVQLIFPSKPGSATRELLKRHAFRWAPSEGAWQRHLNNAGMAAARAVIAGLQQEGSAA